MAGFYGSATSSAKIGMTFDLIYDNRREMDKAAESDGVYNGRYVLVEYGNSSVTSGVDELQLLYRSQDNKFYRDMGKTLWKGTDDPGVEYFRVLGPNHWIPSTSLPVDQIYEIWLRIAGTDGNKFTEDDGLVLVTTATAGKMGYAFNYSVDKVEYSGNSNNFRGYDSTVWQKTYEGGKGKYVMIAELNAIVPTFAIKQNAPGAVPYPPHFDKDSNNVFYNMHIQTPWGFRVKAADNAVLSDVSGDYSVYDKDNEETGTHTEANKPLAIYFGKDKFNPRVDDGSGVPSWDGVDSNNYIKLETAASGRSYSSSHDAFTLEVAPDTQELSINLPAIGDMMEKGWDIIYGPNRDRDYVDSLAGRLDSFDVMGEDHIPIKAQGGALIGTTINGNKDCVPSDILEESLKPGLTEDDAWIQTQVNTVGATENGNYITIHHTFTPTPNTSDDYDVNGNGDTIDLKTPIVDAAGHVVGTHTQVTTLPFGFKTIAISNESTAVIDNAHKAGNIEADTTQDTLTLSPGNKWIHINGDSTTDTVTISHEVNAIDEKAATSTYFGATSGNNAITVYDVSVDEAGHVTANKPHQYGMPNSIQNILVGVKSTSETGGVGHSRTPYKITVDSDKYSLSLNPQNHWITVQGKDETLSIGHATPGTIKETAGDTIDAAPNFGGTFVTPYVKYDAAGHIAESGTRTVTIPTGSLEKDDSTKKVSSVLTSLAFEPTSGKITETHQDIHTLLLSGYTSTSRIKNTQTVGEAFKVLDDYLDNLDYTNEDASKFISKISQVDGKISVERAAAGTLVLGDDYTSPHGKIVKTDNLNSAFNKVETEFNTLDTKVNTEVGNLNSRINTEVKNLSDKIDLLFDDKDSSDLDSVVDLINWVDDHKETVSDIIASIEDNDKDIDDIVEKLKTKDEEIATLQSTITTLTSRITALEEMCQIYPMPGETPTEGESGDAGESTT